MPEPITILDVVLRLAAAAVGGAIVGFERQAQDKPAGLRTNMLVGLGSAGFVLAAIGASQFGVEVDDQVRIDPTRILQGIVGGIGFLGAGAILQSRGNVRGMTTAAALWVVAAVGAACGLGQYYLAGAMAGICLITLYPLGYLENLLAPKEDPPAGGTEDDSAR